MKEIAIASPTLFIKSTKLTPRLASREPDPATRSSITDGEWLLIYGAQVEKSAGGLTASVDSTIREVREIQGDVSPELYHLAQDPGCEKNLIGGHRGVAQDLHAAYVEFLQSKKIPEKPPPILSTDLSRNLSHGSPVQQNGSVQELFSYRALPGANFRRAGPAA